MPAGVLFALFVFAAQAGAETIALTANQEILVRDLIAARTEGDKERLAALSTPVPPAVVDAISRKAATLRTTDRKESERLDRLAVELADRSGEVSSRGKARYEASITREIAGDLAGAVQLSREALDLAREAGDRGMATQALLRLCLVKRQTGDLAAAAEDCIEAIEAAKRAGNRVQEARGRNGLGICYRLQGKNNLALSEYMQSLRLAEAAGEQMGVAYLENNIGEIFESQGNLEAALSYFERSLEIKRRLGKPADVATTAGNVALLRHSTGDDERAAKEAAEVLEICAKLQDAACRGRNLNTLGLIEKRRGRYAAAAAYFRESTPLLIPINQPQSLLNVAETSIAVNDVAEARAAAAEALRMAREFGLVSEQGHAEYILGMLLAKGGRLEEAAESLSKAVTAAESLRTNLAGGEKDRQRFFEDKLVAYRGLAETLIGLKRVGEAFTVAERSRARVLLDVMAAGKSRVVKGVSSEDAEQEAALQQRISELNAALVRERSGKRDAARIGRLEGQLEDARRAYAAFESALYATHPDLKMQRSEIAPAEAGEIARALPAKGVAVEYLVGEKQAYAYVVTEQEPHLRFYRLPATAESINALAAKFRSQLAARDLGYGATSRELYRLLLAPLEPVLKGCDSLVIVPDGAMWQIPFAALENAGGRFLIEDRAIWYAPSLTVMTEMNRRYGRRGAHEPALLALGNPAVAGVPALPAAERELSEISRFYGPERSSVRIRETASEPFVKENAGRYDVLHFATHGVLDNRHPMNSHVMLTPGEAAGEDGLLEAWEMMNLDLHEEVVVLSACETARGAISRGEGLIGMGWALFVAGSPTTVASLWKVDSESTSRLMVDFHRRLRRRLAGEGGAKTKAGALREAMIESMRRPQTRHPFYWAGFVMFGHGI